MTTNLPEQTHPEIVAAVNQLVDSLLSLVSDHALDPMLRATVLANISREPEVSPGSIHGQLDDLWPELAYPPGGVMDQLRFGFFTDDAGQFVVETSVPLFTRSGYSGHAMRLHVTVDDQGFFSKRMLGFEQASLTDLIREADTWTSLDGTPPHSAPRPWDIRRDVSPLASVPREEIDPPHPVPTHVRSLFEEIVRRLVEREYQGLVDDGLATNSPEGIGFWIENYPDELVNLPPEAWNEADMTTIVNQPGAWWVLVPLWGSQGRTDLTLEALLVDGPEPQIEVQLIHVM